jgi:hypothetical protein
MALGIAHLEEREGGLVAVLDAIRERKPPFSPESVVAEFSEGLKSYGVGTITGDRVGGEFFREPLRKAGIDYSLADRVKSEIYRTFLALLNSGRVELLDNKQLVGQLRALERRTAGGGREIIDHPPRGRDDVANSAAGVLLLSYESSEDAAATPMPPPVIIGRGEPTPWLGVSLDRCQPLFPGQMEKVTQCLERSVLLPLLGALRGRQCSVRRDPGQTTGRRRCQGGLRPAHTAVARNHRAGIGRLLILGRSCAEGRPV